MSDFVMSVVNEVLHKSGTDNNELLRPNYQRQNPKKRLMVYELPQTAGTEQVQNLQSNRYKSKGQSDEKEMLYQLSALRINTMSARTKEPPVTAAVTEPAFEASGNHNLDFTVFSLGTGNNIRRLIGFPYSNKEAACIGVQEDCRISQVFLVDELLRQFPALDFTAKWSLGPGEPFVFQAVGTNEMMQTAANILNQSGGKKKAICVVNQPTAYLKKVLNNSAETIGTIEGVHYAKLIPLAAAYLERHKDSMVQYQIYGRYLMVSGQPDEVLEVLKSMESSID